MKGMNSSIKNQHLKQTTPAPRGLRWSMTSVTLRPPEPPLCTRGEQSFALEQTSIHRRHFHRRQSRRNFVDYFPVRADSICLENSVFFLSKMSMVAMLSSSNVSRRRILSTSTSFLRLFWDVSSSASNCDQVLKTFLAVTDDGVVNYSRILIQDLGLAFRQINISAISSMIHRHT